MTFDQFEQYLEKYGIEMFKADYENLTDNFRIYFSLFEEYKEYFAEQASQNSIQVTDGMAVVIGFLVVFAVLLALTGIFYLFGFVMDKSNAPKKPKKEAQAPAKVAAAPAASASVPAPVVQEGISGEVVAAIAAAVAMRAPDGKRYAVKSVARVNGNGRSAWAAAGVADNTRPF